MCRLCRTRVRLGCGGFGGPGAVSEARSGQQGVGSGTSDTTSFPVSPVTPADKSLKPTPHAKSQSKSISTEYGDLRIIDVESLALEIIMEKR